MDLLVRCSFCKCEGLGSDPQHTLKDVEHINFKAGEAETRSLGSAAQPGELNCRALGSVRD